MLLLLEIEVSVSPVLVPYTPRALVEQVQPYELRASCLQSVNENDINVVGKQYEISTVLIGSTPINNLCFI